jgi:hypothetical protein
MQGGEAVRIEEGFSDYEQAGKQVLYPETDTGAGSLIGYSDTWKQAGRQANLSKAAGKGRNFFLASPVVGSTWHAYKSQNRVT